MFNKACFLASILLSAFGLQGCTERPTEMRVNQDFADLKEMLIELDKTYEKCRFTKKTVIPKKEKNRDERWQVFEMKVMIVCDDKISVEKVRILYEYVVDFKDHAGPYWELATWGYEKPFPK